VNPYRSPEPVASTHQPAPEPPRERPATAYPPVVRPPVPDDDLDVPEFLK
jgi:hypothetical protein